MASSLSQAVTAPMSSINAIAVEAYKKYVLVSLIHNGQVCFVIFSLTLLDIYINFGYALFFSSSSFWTVIWTWKYDY